MSIEIVISKPTISTYHPPEYRRFSYWSCDHSLFGHIESSLISPEKQPKVIELFAGDAPIAKILTDRGWKKSGITCVDLQISPTPLVEGVSWKYWNLVELYRILRNGVCPPQEVLDHKGKYDLAFSFFGEIDYVEEKSLTDFFLKEGGLGFAR